MYPSKCLMGCETFDHTYKPRNDQSREKWRIALGLPVFRRSHRICDKHFPKSAFATLNKHRLNPGAVPRLDIAPPKLTLPVEPTASAPQVVTELVPYLTVGSDKEPPTIGFKEIRIPPATTSCVNTRTFFKTTSKAAKASVITDLEADNLCTAPDLQTKGYFLQQTMYRIKDPRRSLPFYNRVLGMTLLQKLDFPDAKFTLYFLGYENVIDVPPNDTERTVWAMSRRATLQLTHNWGTESDPSQKYHNGNYEPRGFGHIGVMVPDVNKACQRFEEQGVEFMKKPNEGRMKGLAFIKDPDGYWIQIFNANTVCQFAALK